jgi:nucleoid-associated protein YgaU
MQLRPLLIFLAGVGLAPLVLSAPGCALFKSKPEASPAARLRATNVSSDQNPVAVPVDIAEDIAQIRDGWEPKGDQPAARAACAPGSTNPACSIKASQRGPATAGQSVRYRVRAGDTLMKISFEEYGDVYRWREIYARNKPVIADFNALVAGTELTIEGVKFVVIQRNGQPYLIARADTLGKISSKLYGTPGKWRDLWHNNPQLIRNPNKIYAGFTLYHQPDVRTPAAQGSAHK